MSAPQFTTPQAPLYGREAEQKAPGQRPGLHSRPARSPVWPLCSPACSNQLVHKAFQGGFTEHPHIAVGAVPCQAQAGTGEPGWGQTSGMQHYPPVTPVGTPLAALLDTFMLAPTNPWGHLQDMDFGHVVALGLEQPLLARHWRGDAAMSPSSAGTSSTPPCCSLPGGRHR